MTEEIKESVEGGAVEQQPENDAEKLQEVKKEQEKVEADKAPESEKKEETVQETEKHEDKQEQEVEVVDIDDLDDETEYSTAEKEALEKLYQKTLKNINEGEIVTGIVLDITEKEVILDISFKSEAIMPLEEFENVKDLKVGQEVEVFLESLEDPNGQMVLSRKRADFVRVWEKVVKKHDDGEPIRGTITRRIKGGMVVNLNGVDAFLPGSQIDVKPIRDFDSYLGKEMDFQIVKVNYPRRNIVVSSRVLIEKEMASHREEILKTIEKGQVRKGIVKNITDFGVFIDLGGCDGLLHITDLSWGRVNHPNEVVKLDEEIEVVILDYNENKDRISLGRKQLLPHPWEKVEERFPIGSTISGKVVSITDYGAFIELETGIEGLIHISEMSWSQHIKHPSQILTVGQEVEAQVLNIESDEKKISLGLKQLEPDPWENIEEKYPLDSKHKGVVRNLTQFGAFVELEQGIDGLVHISDLSWTKKVRHPNEVVKKGDEIDVIVLGINRDERRIALGHKQIEANPWEAFEEKYKESTDTKGKITRIIDKGVIVTLPLGVDGFIPAHHLGHPKLKKAMEYYNIGDEVPAKVLEFDKENKKIVLSVSEYFKQREKNEWEAYLTKQGVEKTTLEDLIKDSSKKPLQDKEKKETKEEKKAKEPEKEKKESKVEDKSEKPEKKEKTVKDKKEEAEKKTEKIPAEPKKTSKTKKTASVKKDTESQEKTEKKKAKKEDK